MLTESARMSSAAEVRFRVAQRPTGRVIKVIGLDDATHGDVQRLITNIPSADIVVMVVTAGRRCPQIGRAHV